MTLSKINPTYFDIHPEVRDALQRGRAIVALESTVISHGLPFPENIQLAMELEDIIRSHHAVPATIALLEGKFKIGLHEKDLEMLADPAVAVHKTSRRDISYVLSQKIPGATTVSATMWAAHRAGIKIFATGGIGGVHRDATNTFDISADLREFAVTPVAVVSAGVKSILDIGATLEYLETMGVPVIGYGTHEFPAFFSRKSGFGVPLEIHDADKLAELLRVHFELKINTGILIANPVPEADGLDNDFIEKIIAGALEEQKKKQIKGKDITPFLLKKIVEKSGGKSLRANISLLKNNAKTAAEIARKLT